jgi:hypothetical protein
MMDALETSIQREREVLSARVEAEKASLSTKLQSLDLELATKARELSAETMRNNDLAEKIHKLERERQDVRVCASLLLSLPPPFPLSSFPSLPRFPIGGANLWMLM